MTKIILYLLLLLMAPVAIQAGGVDEDLYRYEIEAANGASVTPGFIELKVWSYGKRKVLTNDYCMRNAVHGILFKGVAGNGANAGVQPLVPEGYEAHEKFFDDFFEGKYLQFVQISNKGLRDAGDVVLIKKNRYKIGTAVTINLKALRTYLENEKIIKPLDFLFE